MHARPPSPPSPSPPISLLPAVPAGTVVDPRSGRPWRVIKLGGTSVADAAAVAIAIEQVARLAVGKRVAVVISALDGVTDELEGMAEEASRRVSSGDRWSERIRALARRHLELLAALVGPVPAAVETRIRSDLAPLGGLLAALRRGRRDRSDLRILLLSIGERVAARVVLTALRQCHPGCASEGIDAASLLAAAGAPGDALPDLAATRRRIAGHLATSRSAVWVVPGFFARHRQGGLCLLGRGGSDTSATLLGAALGAERVELWTDVDGVYDVDPRLHTRARRFEHLDFDTAERLAREGARVLHHRSLAPARTAGVPVLVCSSRRPDGPGTWIGPAHTGRGQRGGGW